MALAARDRGWKPLPLIIFAIKNRLHKKGPAEAGPFETANFLRSSYPNTPGPKNVRGAHMMMSGMKMHISSPSHCRHTNGTTPL